MAWTLRRHSAPQQPQSVATASYLSPERRNAVLEHYRGRPVETLNVATVQDYCESVEGLPEITGLHGDLKDVQRPWTAKSLIALLEPGSTVLEIGAGKPDAGQVLVECGYQVIAVDPYEGVGNGPTQYDTYKRYFPNVDIRKAAFDEGLNVPQVDAIYSISTLEHIPDLEPIFRAIHKFLKPGGISLHCVDVVIRGFDESYHIETARNLLRFQGQPDNAWDELLARATGDLETYYLGPSGHQLWRGNTPYRHYPYRRILSLQTYARSSDLLLSKL